MVLFEATFKFVNIELQYSDILLQMITGLFVY